MSKQLLVIISDPDIIEKIQFNQWRNTDAILKWLNNITDRNNCSFIQFDINESSATDNILH